MENPILLKIHINLVRTWLYWESLLLMTPICNRNSAFKHGYWNCSTLSCPRLYLSHHFSTYEDRNKTLTTRNVNKQSLLDTPAKKLKCNRQTDRWMDTLMDNVKTVQLLTNTFGYCSSRWYFFLFFRKNKAQCWVIFFSEW